MEDANFTETLVRVYFDPSKQFIEVTEENKNEIFTSTHNQFPNIRELQVIYHSYSFVEAEDILKPLNQFNHLEKLKICLFPSFRQLGQLKIPTLKSLDVQICAIQPLLDLILNQQVDLPNDFNMLNRFIVNHPGLESIQIEDSMIYDSMEKTGLALWIEFCLQVASNLKSVTIKFAALSTFPDNFTQEVDQIREKCRQTRPEFALTLLGFN